MFDLDCQASIAKVTVSAKTKDGVTLRKVRIALDREFDDLLAAAIGRDAKRALEGLAKGGLVKATMPLDAVSASLKLSALEGDEVAIPRVLGVKAVASAPTDEDSPPSVRLEFEFAFSDAAWTFFGRNIGGFATISIKQAQMELAKAS